MKEAVDAVAAETALSAKKKKKDKKKKRKLEENGNGDANADADDTNAMIADESIGNGVEADENVPEDSGEPQKKKKKKKNK